MGTYVYALNTKTREISGHSVGLAEFRYKPSWGWDGSKLNQKWHNRFCARRVTHFENYPSLIPEFFVMGEFCEDNPVFKCDLAHVWFYDSLHHTVVGKLKKIGRSWTIVFNEGFPQAKTAD